MQLPFDYNLFFLVVEHAYMVCPDTYIVLFWKIKGTSVYWPWSKGIHSNETKSPNWLCLLTSETKFLGFFGPLGTKAIDFWFARAIPWPTTRPIAYVMILQGLSFGLLLGSLMTIGSSARNNSESWWRLLLTVDLTTWQYRFCSCKSCPVTLNRLSVLYLQKKKQKKLRL